MTSLVNFGGIEWKDEIYLFNVINSKLMLNNEYSIVDFNKQKLEELNLKNEYLLLIHCLKKRKKQEHILLFYMYDKG